MRHKPLAATVILAAAILASAASALAVDGVIEINQPKVLAAGGFPYTISTAGSYRLTGNLSDAGQVNAITITVPNVTIDLNGFSITGPGAPNALNGIGGVAQTEVKNGTITGFNAAVVLGGNSIVRNVRAVSNGDGIDIIGANGLVDKCAAVSNLHEGIQCTSSGCVISGNTANLNDIGIFCGDCTISGNVANNNNTDGIRCSGSKCAISGNTANNNVSYGISVHSSGLVVRNQIGGNGLQGLLAADGTTGYGANVFQGNNGVGAQVSSGTSLGAGNTNLCNGSTC